MTNIRFPLFSIAAFSLLPMLAHAVEPTDSLEAFAAAVDSLNMQRQVDLKETTVRAKRRGVGRSFATTENTQTLSLHELSRAACCNLGESFVTNPSVDVNYNDAATGARQIRLLGLSGTYVQMMTENVPNFRIVAQPYGLNYTPGPWMQSIQVSKGAASVKNGYESITGQINTELKKPQQMEPYLLGVNGYMDMRGRVEANVETTHQLNASWGTTVLGHYDKHLMAHDANNDGFADMPKLEQFNLLNRWTYNGGNVFSQLLVRGLSEARRSGQIVGNAPAAPALPYRIDIDTRRVDGFAKTAYMLDDEQKTNFAFIVSGALHDQDALFGARRYDVTHSNAYVSLLYEAQWTSRHAVSAGLSFNYDRLHRELYAAGVSVLNGALHNVVKEAVPGAYAQYTFTLGNRLTLMGGLRIDHSNLYGTFVTPRAHFKFSPNQRIAFRLSVGKGQRTTHVLEENNFFLASARTLEMENEHLREVAWNYGASVHLRLPVFAKVLNVNVEYYYTDFLKQAVADFDSSPSLVRFYQLDGKSYSSVLQAEATYPFFEGFSLTAACRFADVQTTYDLYTGAQRLEKPLQSRVKAMLTASYATPMDIWQFDATLQLNGGGRLPQNYCLADGRESWSTHCASYAQLAAQITRNFRRWSVYVGGENLTGYRQRNAIVDAAQPWGDRFDATMIYAPLEGAMAYVGFRYNIER